jgi:hypothetical protein
MKNKETPETMLTRVMTVAALLSGQSDDEVERYFGEFWKAWKKSKHTITHTDKPETKIVQLPKNDVS